MSISQTATVALRDSAVSGSGVLFKLAGDLTIILFIAFFVLSGGPALAARFLNLWGDRPGLRLRAEHAALECVRQIRIYCGVLLVTNTIVGLGVWIAFALAGLPDATGWGVTAAVLHVVPYLGMALLTGLGAAETFLAFGSVGPALGMAGFLVLLSVLIGTVVASWLQGRAARMSAAAVFIGVVFWGALWGVWGLLLGPALVVLLKVVAEHTRPGQRLAHLMQG
jgi:predicted PurR-regulated permease PerM